jgi:hypothetical protein
MIVGARNFKEMKESLALRFLRFFLRSIIVYFTGRSSPDANSGIRLFKKSLAVGNESLFSLLYSFTTSLTLFCHLTGRFVEYVPVRFSPRMGVSKVRHVRDSIRTLKLIMSMVLLYRSFRYFTTIVFAGLALFVLITLLRPVIGPQMYLPLIIMLAANLILISLGAICSVLGQIYFSNKNT